MRPITIVLAENYSDWEIAPLAGLGRAFYAADIRFVSLDGEPVTSVAGLMVVNVERFEAPEEGVVVVCGSPHYESTSLPDITEKLQTAHKNGCIIAGICGGTVALARAQLLDNVHHTSNGVGYIDGLVPEYRGSDKYIDQPFAVQDGQIITAPAPAPASFAVEVLTAAGFKKSAVEEIQKLFAREHKR